MVRMKSRKQSKFGPPSTPPLQVVIAKSLRISIKVDISLIKNKSESRVKFVGKWKRRKCSQKKLVREKSSDS